MGSPSKPHNCTLPPALTDAICSPGNPRLTTRSLSAGLAGMAGGVVGPFHMRSVPSSPTETTLSSRNATPLTSRRSPVT